MENEIIEGDPIRMFKEETRFKVKDIANESHFDPWCDINVDATLKDAIVLLTKNNLRRVAVVAGERVIHVLTLTDILKYLLNKRLIDSVLQQEVESLHSDHKAVIKIKNSEPTNKALKLMKQNNINGVAVVDQQDRIVGNISASDLKSIKFDSTLMPTLRSPIQQFLQDRQKIIYSVAPHSKIEEVMNSMISHRVHRMYVVDTNNHVLSCISQLDIVKLIASKL